MAWLLVAAAAAACSGGPGRGAGGGRIEVTAATYGENCGAPGGNVTTSVATSCNGRLNCDYKVEASRLGDPVTGCPKAFVVRYRCKEGAAERRVKLDAEAGFGSVASLTCE